MSEYRSMMEELQSVHDSFIEEITRQIEDDILERVETLANSPKAYSIAELRLIMLAKAGHIKMKVHPEVFLQIADKLDKLEDLVTITKKTKPCTSCDMINGQDGG